ncbi:TonB-linked SusC/RagA family outer membrane protein [Chitinophaga skermanii]|uniref:TonB-linked SusC/RagA family outer membrane protein n=1 Tax=Chitinophaga skermanii TaxID=331697 RepID=A0A327QU45_9BACT|nr:TonB-dependent receptor [Chitinophaga skermanii]RAJ08176.1 TonB-linked SusC/RagA family outer membrane protein [Chitinophaga skermanii]
MAYFLQQVQRVTLLICCVVGTSLTISAQTKPLINSHLSGRVMDAQTKEPLPGAAVQIQGTTHGVITDQQGKFSFVTGQPFPYTLIVTYTGYKKLEIVANNPNIDIALEVLQSQLNDVVVVGYGTKKKSDLTGAISSVNNNLFKQPVSSIDQALKGSVPGVQVVQTSGQPGGGVSIRVRGGSSIQGGNEPLYVIDGFPVYNSTTNAGTTSGTPINPLASINPADIENIDILKDASATAIYGSRGANGVVIVTTKKGRADRSNISWESSYGVQSLRKKIDVLNAQEFAILRNEVLFDTNPAKGPNQYLSNEEVAKLGKGTDWQDAAFRSGNIQNHQLTISGGSAKTRYLLSGNYFTQEGIIRHTDFNRISLRANIDAQPYERLKISSSITASKSDANIAPSGIVSSLLLMPPTATIYEPNGSYTLRNPFENIFANPIATLNEQLNKSTTNRFFGTAFGELKVIEGLHVKVLLGADVNTTNEKLYIPSTIYEGTQTGGAAGRGNYSSYSWLNENTITYNKNIGRHAFDVLGGFTQQEFNSDVVRTGAEKFVTDQLKYNSLQSGATLVRPFSNTTSWVLHSWLARVNYTYDNRLYLTASIRTDGSSRFGKGNKWGYFPSAAVSWRIGNEDFFKRYKQTISDLKLRASFGVTGNLEIGEYQSLATLYSVTYIIGNKILTGFTPNRIANDQLGWETTDQYNAGIDVGLWNNRVLVTLDGYYKKTRNLLLNVELPWTSGQASSLQNFGSVENRGIEIGINSKNFVGDFTWSTDFNFSLNRNKVLSLGNGAKQYITGNYIIQVGQPLGSFYGTVTNGILQTGEEKDKGAFTGNAAPKPGDRLYKDINKDGTFTTAADRAIIGNAQPNFLAGIQNHFSYHGVSLSVFFQGSFGNKILNGNRQSLELFTGQQNAAGSARDRWTATNPSQTIPRAKLDPAPIFSDRFIEDGTFVRLKNIALSYDISRNWLHNIAGIQVYVSAQNLLTWTKYTGFDPEVTSGSNVSPGTDAGIYPVAKTFNAGIKVSF